MKGLKESFVYKKAAGWADKGIKRLSGEFNGISHRVLPNGLTADIRGNPRDKVMTLKVTVHSGTLQNPPGKEGLAHFLEHMMFTQNDATFRAMTDSLHERGGAANAYTGDDRTVYTFSIPEGADNEAFLYRMVSRALFSFNPDPSQVNEEKTVVAHERRDHLNRDERTMDYQALRAAYGTSNTDHALGTPETIAGFTAADLLAFHARHYVPANTTVEIIGSPHFPETFRNLKENFGRIPAGKKPENEENINYQGGYAHIEDNSAEARTQIAAAFFYPSFGSDPEYFAAGEVLASYLQMAMRDEFRGPRDRKLYSFIAGWQNQGHGRLLCLQAATDPGEAGTVLPALTRIVSDIAAGKIDQRRLRAAIATSRTAGESYLQEQISRRDNVSNPYVLRKNHRHALQTIESMTPEQLSWLVNNTLLSRPPSLAVVGPAENVQSYEEFRTMLPASAPQSQPKQDKTPSL